MARKRSRKRPDDPAAPQAATAGPSEMKTGPAPQPRVWPGDLRGAPEPPALRLRDAALVFALAAVVRFVYVLVARGSDPFFGWSAPGFDQHVYQTWALAILDGDPLLRVAKLFYFSPVFAYFLAPIYAVFGRENFMAVHVTQAMIGAATCALVYLLARSWLSRAGAWAAALLYVFSSHLLFWEQALLHEGLIQTFYVVALCGLRWAQLTDRRKWLGLILAGCALELAVIGRGNAMAVVAMALVWVPLGCARPLAEGEGWRERLRAPRRWNWVGVAALIGGMLLVMGPLLARNHHISGRWTLGMGVGPVQFYLGNARDSTGEFAYSPRFEEARAKAKEDPGIYWKMFFEDVREAPGQVLRNTLRKVYFFWASRDAPDNLNLQLAKQLIWPLRVTPVQWWLFVPLGLVGFALSWMRPWRFSLLLLFTLAFSASLILIVPTGRYRGPVLIAMAVFAGAALEWAWAAWKARRFEALALAGIGLLALILISWPWPEPYTHIRVNDYTNAMRAAVDSGQPRIAERVLAIGMDETDSGTQRARAERVYLLRFALQQAIDAEDAERALELCDRIVQTRAFDRNLAFAMIQLYMRNGRLVDARQLARMLVRANPEDEQARLLLQQLGGGGSD